MPRPRTLVIFGSGPGIALHTAASFAPHVQHIVLLARNTSRLQSDDTAFLAKHAPGIKVSTVGLDLANTDSIPGVLKQIDDLTKEEDVEVVFFNAATIKPGDVLGVSLGEIEGDFRIQTLALYTIFQHYLPRLQALAKNSSFKPAFLVTNSALPWEPIPQLLSLSLNKAAQKNLVESLHQAFKDTGVHIGLVYVEGAVADDNKVLNAKTIGERIVAFWKEEKGLATHIKEE